MAYDIVIPLKEQEPNPDLVYTLRSIDKFGGEHGDIYIVGHKPEGIVNIKHLETEQTGSKWENSLLNRVRACEEPSVSDKFILFNDDFFLTVPVDDWDKATNMHCGTLLSNAEELERKGFKVSVWRQGFRQTHNILVELGVERPLSYEYHGPMLIDKKGFLEVVELIKQYKEKSPSVLIFPRSLYGNLHPRRDVADAVYTRDTKARGDATSEQFLYRNGFFSVKDKVTTNPHLYPRINAWLQSNLSEQCRYEAYPYFATSSV